MHLKPRIARVLLALVTLLLVVAFGQLLGPQLKLRSSSLPHSIQAKSYVTVKDTSASEEPGSLAIDIGVRVRTIHDINLPEQKFNSEGWYWLQWGEDVQTLIERYGLDPHGVFEIANLVRHESSHQNKAPVRSVVRNEKKIYYTSGFYSGEFFIPNVDLRNSPFGRLSLPIIFEVGPRVLSLQANRVYLRPEMNTETDPIAGEFSNISGFTLVDAIWQRAVATYLSPPDASSGSRRAFSRATALLIYSPGFWPVFVQWILPLVVVMGIVVLTPSLDGALGDSRLAIPTAALLTLIFLHLGYKTSFPETPYLTYLDMLYAYSYGVCIVIFILFVLSSNAHTRDRREGGERTSLARRDRIESVVQVSVLVGYLCVAVLGWRV